MFGADVSQVPFWDNSHHEEVAQTHTWDYLLPQYTPQLPWPQASVNQKSSVVWEDFIMIAEFSEQEGPRPVIVIPTEGGQDFDQNLFSVKIMSVDHQSSISENCELTEDAQVVMSDPDQHAYSFIHHILLNDIQARGYVRPFCISYVTADPLKVMKCYEELSSQMKMVSRLLKYGNRLVFMRDLEKHLEDLSYTKAHLLLSQSRCQATTTQGDSELLNTLNIIRQSMEEVKDILANLKPLLVDAELAERFQSFERELRSSKRHTPEDTNSLQDFRNRDPGPEVETSGSFTDKEFSLFNKCKDLKPKLLDVSTIKGKRRFDRSLRVLHELCSWGAREGLQRLRSMQEFLKRDLSSIHQDEKDTLALSPDCGVLSYGYSCVGANFLSSYNSRDDCCLKRRLLYVDGPVHHGHLRSLGSVDSFKSLSSSFQSLRDDDPMYSANSSMIDSSSHFSTLDRQNSTSDGYGTHDSSEVGLDEGDIFFGHDIESLTTDTSHELEQTVRENRRDSAQDFERSLRDYGASYTGSLVETLRNDSLIESMKAEQQSSKSLNAISESSSLNKVNDKRCYTVDGFVNIDAEHDLKCSVKGCRCGDTVAFTRRLSSGKVDPDSEDDVFRKSGTQDDNTAGSLLTEQPENSNKSHDSNNCNSYAGQQVRAKDGVIPGELQVGDIHGNVLTENIASETFQGRSDALLRESNAIVCDSDTDAAVSNAMTDSTSTLCDNPTAVILNEDNQIDESDNQDSGKDQSKQEDECILADKDSNYILMALNSDAITGAQEDIKLISNEEIGRGMLNDITAKSKSKLNKVNNGDENAVHGTAGEGEIVSESDTEGRSTCDSNISYKGKDTTRPYLDSPDQSLSSTRLEESIDSTRSSQQKGKQFITSAEYLNQPYKYGRRHHWSLLHPLSNIQDCQCAALKCVRRLVLGYNNLQQIVFSLLSGRPVIVMGTRKHESCVRDFTQALTLFCPVTPGCDAVTMLCPRKQLKVSDLHKFRLRGLIRSDRTPLEYLVPASVRKYITLVDLEKLLIQGQPYQGTLLHFLSTIYNKKRQFKSDQALLTYIQMCLMDISTKAFNFFHCITSGDTELDFSGTTVVRKSAMLELSDNKYLNKAGLLNSDCQIIKHLSEIVKIQQIDEEFKCKYLADTPVYPFGLTHHPVQTFRL